MKTTMNCEQCQDGLFNYVESTLAAQPKQDMDEHLQNCEECSAMLTDIWEMQNISMRWHDEPTPKWNRSMGLFDTNPWPFRLQWAASFASIFVLVLVLGEVRISTNDGLTIDFGRDYVSPEQLNQQLVALKNSQKEELNTNVVRLTENQVATNQLLLRTMLDTRRRERREDLGSMLVLLEEQQSQQTNTTQESLRYLIASQVKDRQEIEELNDALLQVDTDRNF